MKIMLATDSRNYASAIASLLCHSLINKHLLSIYYVVIILGATDYSRESL